VTARAFIAEEHLGRHHRLLDGLIEGFKNFSEGPDLHLVPAGCTDIAVEEAEPAEGATDVPG
jgi:hypothetical protein